MTSLPIPGADGLTDDAFQQVDDALRNSVPISSAPISARRHNAARFTLAKLRTALAARPAPIQAEVGCERADGLLNIHPENAACEVCAPLPAVLQAAKDALTLISRNIVGGRWMRSDAAIVTAALGVIADYEAAPKDAVVEARPDLAKIADTLQNCASMLDTIKMEWTKNGSWSEYDQGVRNAVSQCMATLFPSVSPFANPDRLKASAPAPQRPTGETK